MKEFKPTYLCIKQHSVTGLLYLCKTTYDHIRMLSYRGSGKPYWNDHLKIHGKEFVETPWYCLFYDKEEIEKFALLLSEQMNIVKARDINGKKIWANLIPENGLDGGSNKGLTGGTNSLKGKPSPHKGKPSKNKGKESKLKGRKRGAMPEERKITIAQSMIGKNKGKIRSDEAKKSQILKMTGKQINNKVNIKDKTWEEIYGIEGARLRRESAAQRREARKFIRQGEK